MDRESTDYHGGFDAGVEHAILAITEAWHHHDAAFDVESGVMDFEDFCRLAVNWADDDEEDE